MGKITSNATSERVKLHYTDYGAGQPIILIHGWPLSSKSWEKQLPALVDAGYRVIAYDRRGFGHSTSPWNGYDYDSLAGDLQALITELDLQDVVLVGFSMGGGEVVRYITRYGSERISKIALVSSIIPLVKRKDDNPAGVPEKDLKDILTNLKQDRLAFLTTFHRGFYNFDANSDKVSPEQLQYDFTIAANAAPQATVKAAQAWMDTDFREECPLIEVDTLIIHGDADETVPITTSAEQAAQLIPNSKLLVYPGAPHGLNVTHADRLNQDLLDFLKTRS